MDDLEREMVLDHTLVAGVVRVVLFGSVVERHLGADRCHLLQHTVISLSNNVTHSDTQC